MITRTQKTALANNGTVEIEIDGRMMILDSDVKGSLVNGIRLTTPEGYELAKTDTLVEMVGLLPKYNSGDYCDHCGTLTNALTQYHLFREDPLLCSDCIYEIDEGRALR